MYPPVKSVRTLDHYRLLLQFGNGEERVFDVLPYLNLGKFAELRDVSLFNSVVIRFDTIEWANHLDIDPEFLYEKSVVVKAKRAKRSSRRAKARS